jgi:hypothetical protein
MWAAHVTHREEDSNRGGERKGKSASARCGWAELGADLLELALGDGPSHAGSASAILCYQP